jgi:hypothetical protein
MVNIFVSSVVDRGFELRLGRQTKYSVVVASPRRMQHYGEIAKTEWGDMSPAECCFCKLALKNGAKIS